MLRKNPNQSEDLNLLAESFHSDTDSVDLSERHLNDEQFKLVTKAFSQIQTMLQINHRHEGDEGLPSPKRMPLKRGIKQEGLSENLFDSKP
jgi:hypothetical protein